MISLYFCFAPLNHQQMVLCPGFIFQLLKHNNVIRKNLLAEVVLKIFYFNATDLVVRQQMTLCSFDCFIFMSQRPTEGLPWLILFLYDLDVKTKTTEVFHPVWSLRVSFFIIFQQMEKMNFCPQKILRLK